MELSIKEKAKAYDDALKKAEDYRKRLLDEDNPEWAGEIEKIFPELKESEDERIRKAIYNALKYLETEQSWDFLDNVDILDAYAWLEKQGEQKHIKNIVETWKEMRLEVYAQTSGNRHEPNYSDDTTKMFSLNDIEEIIEKISEQESANSEKTCKDEQKSVYEVKPKFNVGDWVVLYYSSTYIGKKVVQISRVEETKSHVYKYWTEDGTWFDDGTIARLWTIEDAKNGDVLASENGWTCIFNCLNDNLFSSHCFMDDEEWFCEDGGQAHTLNSTFGEIHPATKEQCDRLFQKIKEAGCEWDANKKELKKIEQKSTDKDETKFHECEWISNNKKDESKKDNCTVTERIKTFDDACNALGDEHPLVTQYRLSAAAYKGSPMTQDHIAYLKLRIIVAALNEGWEPKFEKDEYRYFPWFYLYTKKQYDMFDDEKKGRCVLRSGNYTDSYYGFVFCYANYDASYSSTSGGSRLALRTLELAEYAGRQFIKEWADFLFKTE